MLAPDIDKAQFSFLLSTLNEDLFSSIVLLFLFCGSLTFFHSFPFPFSSSWASPCEGEHMENKNAITLEAIALRFIEEKDNSSVLLLLLVRHLLLEAMHLLLVASSCS